MAHVAEGKLAPMETQRPDGRPKHRFVECRLKRPVFGCVSQAPAPSISVPPALGPKVREMLGRGNPSSTLVIINLFSSTTINKRRKKIYFS